MQTDLEKLQETDRIRWEHYRLYKEFSKKYEDLQNKIYDDCEHEWVIDKSDPFSNNKICTKCG